MTTAKGGFHDVFTEENKNFIDIYEVRAARPATTISSAGWNSGALGRAALSGLVGLKASSRLMDTAHAQAQKFQLVLEVARIRAAEALAQVEKLIDQSKVYSTGKYYQLATGKGFGDYNWRDPDNPNAGDPLAGAMSGAMGGAMGALGGAGPPKWEEFPQFSENPYAPPGQPKKRVQWAKWVVSLENSGDLKTFLIGMGS